MKTKEVGFEKQLFISYAHLDNLPIFNEPKGWVTRFHAALEALLTIRLGRKAVIWRDEKLGGNDVFADEIVDQFPKVAILLCVLSPRYIESAWCTKEVVTFCDVAQRNLGLIVKNKSRVVKLIKAPFDDPLPEVMQSALGYQFFEIGEDGAPVEFDPIFGQAFGEKFNLKVNTLAWQLHNALKLIDEAVATHSALEPASARLPSAEEEPSTHNKPFVYLAEVTFDQREAREAVEAELKMHGYSVLPEQVLPRDQGTYTTEVAKLLERCELSIHLIGSQYGTVLNGPTDKSVVILQNEIATQCCHRNGLQRVIWLPESLRPSNEMQKAFIQQLHTDAQAQFNADLITSNEIETLKAAMNATLERIKVPVPHVDPAEIQGKLVYLICDQRDRENTVSLRKFLINQGFEIKIPVFDGDAATLRQANETLLRMCNSVLIYYGNGGEAWKRSVEGEVRKMLCGPTGSPFVWTYLGAPETEAKRDLIEMSEPRLIDCLPGFSETAVLPFVQELAGGRP